ncbi:MAG: tetratricopeptide repeat protein [Rhodovibrionaceae bacterium]
MQTPQDPQTARPQNPQRDPLAPAVAAYRQGDFAAAKRLCGQLLAQSPKHGGARTLSAAIDLDMGRPEAAAAQLEMVIAENPKNAAAFYSLGRAYRLQGESEAAEEALREAARLDPKMAAAYAELSELLRAKGDKAAAKAELERGIAACPGSSLLINNLGSLLAQDGDHDAALEAFRKAIAANPQDAVSHYNTGRSLRDRDRIEEAVAAYRKALELNPKMTEAWHNLGTAMIDLGRPLDAARAHFEEFRLRRFEEHPVGIVSGRGDMTKTSRSKLRHDIEQLNYLRERKLTQRDLGADIAAYQAVLDRLPAAQGETAIHALTPEERQALAPTYNRAVHWDPEPALKGPAVNAALDRAAIEADYLGNGPGFTFVDDFLSPEALEGLRRFCLASTIWYEYRYANGYLGAFLDEGFVCPLLLQIAEELRQAFPGIFKDHPLRKLWSFKCDSQLKALERHADFAAVNVNFWITPDSANLDPATGGLVVWDKEAPLDWDFEKYNSDQAAIEAFLAESGAKAMEVPHRQNRVVIFNSDLFHRSGEVSFKEGYENRRLNVTMLYGKRESA